MIKVENRVTGGFASGAINKRSQVYGLILEKHMQAVSGMRHATFAIFVALISFLSGVIYISNSTGNYSFALVFCLGIVSVVALSAGIVSMISSSRSANKIDHYRDELVMLGNTETAVDSSRHINDKRMEFVPEKKQ